MVVHRHPDGANPPVHHVRWRDPVHARLRVRQRHPAQDPDALVVDDLTLDQQTVVSVRGIGIQRHVGLHAEIGKRRLQRPDRPLDQPVRLVRHRGALVLYLRIAEQIHAADARGRVPSRIPARVRRPKTGTVRALSRWVPAHWRLPSRTWDRSGPRRSTQFP